MFGMMKGKGKGKKLPQGDNTSGKRSVPKTGADDNPKTKQAGKETAPFLPDRDGPAKDKAGGKAMHKPKTSAKIKGMKSYLDKVK
jgi:hypothetical protein